MGRTLTPRDLQNVDSIICRAVLIIEIVPTWGHVHVDVGVVVDLEGLSLRHRLGLCVYALTIRNIV